MREVEEREKDPKESLGGGRERGILRAGSSAMLTKQEWKIFVHVGEENTGPFRTKKENR